jgi:hypothetical protein
MESYIAYPYGSHYLKATRNNPDPALLHSSADPNLRSPINPRQLLKHKTEQTQSYYLSM